MLYIPDIVSEPDPADGLISRACMARYLLGLLAEDFSQTYHFVSWSEDLPFLFWDAVHEKEVDAVLGRVKLPPAERKLILELSTVADGWWVAYPDFADPSESFISLSVWQERVAARDNLQPHRTAPNPIIPTPPPSPTRAELAREVLLHRMRAYSEDFHSAGWLSGLEFLLWETPSPDVDSPSARNLQRIIPELRVLAEIADGWWVYEDATHPNTRGPVFIPMQRWLQVHARNQPHDS